MKKTILTISFGFILIISFVLILSVYLNRLRFGRTEDKIFSPTFILVDRGDSITASGKWVMESEIEMPFPPPPLPSEINAAEISCTKKDMTCEVIFAILTNQHLIIYTRELDVISWNNDNIEARGSDDYILTGATPNLEKFFPDVNCVVPKYELKINTRNEEVKFFWTGTINKGDAWHDVMECVGPVEYRLISGK